VDRVNAIVFDCSDALPPAAAIDLEMRYGFSTVKIACDLSRK
jgi:hypothetical protein